MHYGSGMSIVNDAATSITKYKPNLKFTFNSTMASYTGSTNYDYVDQYITAWKALNIIFLIITLWLIFTMIICGKKTNKFDKTEGRKLYVACIIVVALTIPRWISELVMFYAYETGTLQYCEIYMDACYALGIISITATFIFLWLKQQTIYQHPFLLQLVPKWLATLSLYMLGIICVAGLGFLLAFTIPDTYNHTSRACILKRPNGRFYVAWDHYLRNYVAGVFLLIAKVLLLVLFIYPMALIQIQTYSTQHPEDQETSAIRKIFIKKAHCSQSGSIRATIQRAIICTIIAILSDFLALIIAKEVIHEKYMNVVTPDSVYGVSYIVNTFCIIATFDCYLSIFVPCYQLSDTQDDSCKTDSIVDKV